MEFYVLNSTYQYSTKLMRIFHGNSFISKLLCNRKIAQKRITQIGNPKIKTILMQLVIEVQERKVNVN